MTESQTGDDGALLAALDRALTAARSVPPEFIATGKASFAWHGIDAELASLTRDSLNPEPAHATRAEKAAIRCITFAARNLTIELEIGPQSLTGQLIPHQPGEVELELPNGKHHRTDADHLGYFVFNRVPTTSFRLQCKLADGPVVSTPWVTP